MKELVEKIEKNVNYLKDMVFILNNGFEGMGIYSKQTVKEQINIYWDCIDMIKEAMDEVVEKYGDVKLEDLK